MRLLLLLLSLLVAVSPLIGVSGLLRMFTLPSRGKETDLTSAATLV